MWLLICPQCVRSPRVIVSHHIVSLLYILVPFSYPEYDWAMGYCMLVEINTWFLIARRYFNKQGRRPFFEINVNAGMVTGGKVKSLFGSGVSQGRSRLNRSPSRRELAVKVISVLFYISWIATRLAVSARLA